MQPNAIPEASLKSGAGSPLEVFWASLRLGFTSFGGPVAHLGYFQRAYVHDRRWLRREEYVAIVGLCHLLPGPTSSQVGLLIGFYRAGSLGALAAWTGFTLPSALLMCGFALFLPEVHGPWMSAALHGLALTAVAVVAQAVWTMARNLCPDWERAAIAVVAAAVLLLDGSGALQLATIAGGALAGSVLCRRTQLPNIDLPLAANVRLAWISITVFCALLAVLPVLAALSPHGPIALANIFFREGSLVFGGGHVVLPLLREALVPNGWISDDTFLSGYGLAQGMPGPLFSIGAFLGAASAPKPYAIAWGALALIAVFLPGMLLALAALAFSNQFARNRAARSILAGVNASVVGILAAALYTPVWTNAIHTASDIAVALTGFLLLERWRTPPIAVVLLCILASVALVATMGR
jgi:chromate transporter